MERKINSAHNATKPGNSEHNNFEDKASKQKTSESEAIGQADIAASESKAEENTGTINLADSSKAETAKKDERKIPLKERLQKIWNAIWDLDREFNRLTQSLVKTVRIITVSLQEFIKDDCLSRASSIAYTTIVSLIPTLTVGFSLFYAFGGLGTKKEEIFKLVEQYIREHNINIDITPFKEAIISVTNNAAQIGGVSLLVLIFSATAVLRTLEKTFNTIWSVKVQRPVLMKIIYYWAALTLGPMLLTTGGSLAGIMANIFTMPSIYDTQIIENRLWVAGDRGLLYHSDINLKNKVSVNIENIDFDNQHNFLMTNEASGSAIALISDEDKIISTVGVEDIKKAHFRSIEYSDNRIWVLSEEGLILTTKDKGQHWYVSRIGQRGGLGNYIGLQFRDAYFIDENNGFIAGRDGLLIKTVDGGKSWLRVLLQFPLQAMPRVLLDLNQIHVYGENKLAVIADKAVILLSDDNGLSWRMEILDKAKRKNSPIQLLAINSHKDDSEMWIVGKEGLILYSDDMGQNWINRTRGDYDYNAVLALGQQKAIVAGHDGYLLYTTDAGERWIRLKKGSWNYYTLAHFGEEIIALGDNLFTYKAVFLENGEIDWQKLMGGQSFIYKFINFLAPFAVIWLLFVIAYITLPNTKVPFKPAAIGASVTSAVWVMFILSFAYYVKNFTGGTEAIYGALAIIPISLLMIYASAVITLLGAELTFTIQNPRVYMSAHRIKKNMLEQSYIFDSINVLYHIFKNFEDGKGPTSEKELKKLIHSDPASLSKILQMYQDNDFITPVDIEGHYQPNKSGRSIFIVDVIDLVSDKTYEIPHFDSSNALMKFMKQNFEEFEQFRQKKLSEVTVDYLVTKLD